VCLEVKPFHDSYVSPTVLKRLLGQTIVVQTLYSKDYETAKLYTIDVPAKFFCLILEGCMEVKVGKDGLIFESRSFFHFGMQALLNTLENPIPDYRPDFSAWPSKDCLVVIITQQQYRAARKASTFEKERSSYQTRQSGSGEIQPVESKDYFTAEWAKAETSDFLEVSKSKGTGGLASIGRYLSRSTSQDPGGRAKVKPTASSSESMPQDQRRLLSMSSNEEVSFTSMELQEMGENQEPVVELNSSPLFNGSGRQNWSRRFRTSPESSSVQGASTQV